MGHPSIATAIESDVDDVLPLFAAYQRFYTGHSQDDEKNRAFLSRFVSGDAGRLLVARDEAGAAVGFANLYWTFSSTRGEEHVLLNDLFVAESARGTGLGRALIEAALDVARERGLRKLSWMTAHDNHAAQRLYDRMDAEKTAWFEYELEARR